MRYVLAPSFGALMLFGFLIFAGAGHGWIAGAYSCLALAPISFAAWFNALRTGPSLRIAFGLLVAAGLVLVATAFATWVEGVHYFFRYWQVQGFLGGLVIALVYLNWAFACGVTWWRRRGE